MRFHLFGGLALAMLASAPSGASAQDGSVPGVQFAGCWIDATGTALNSRTCVIPGEGALRIVAVDANGGTTESVLRLDGSRQPVDAAGCTGWEQARLSRDGERVVVDAELTCNDEPRRRRTTTLSITPSGHWLQATGSALAQITSAQVHAFAPAESYAEVPEATRREVMPFLVAAERARTRMRDAKVSAADLGELEEMEVATPLIDVLVAASYPKSFVLDGTGGVPGAVPTVSRSGAEARQALAMNQMLFQNGFPMLSMYDWGAYYSCMRFGGLSCPMNYFGYSRFGWGDPYNSWRNFGFGGWGYGPGVTVVVRPTPTTPSAPTSGGRAVRGTGYTQTSGGSTRGTAQPRASTGASYGSGSASANSGGASSSGSASGGGQRTAKPRDP